MFPNWTSSGPSGIRKCRWSAKMASAVSAFCCLLGVIARLIKMQHNTDYLAHLIAESSRVRCGHRGDQSRRRALNRHHTSSLGSDAGRRQHRDKHRGRGRPQLCGQRPTGAPRVQRHRSRECQCSSVYRFRSSKYMKTLKDSKPTANTRATSVRRCRAAGTIVSSVFRIRCGTTSGISSVVKRRSISSG